MGIESTKTKTSTWRRWVRDRLFTSGTWTPVLKGGTTTLTSVVNGTAIYTKIGQQVTLMCDITCSNLNGETTSSVTLEGMPYSAQGSGRRAGSIGQSSGMNISAGESVTLYCSNADDALHFRLWDVTSGSSNLRSSELSATGRISLNIIYLAAE